MKGVKMGVDYTAYVMYGTQFSYSNDLSVTLDEIENEDSIRSIEFICDGMGAKYIMIGRILCVGDEGDGWSGPVRMSFVSDADKVLVKKQIEDIVGHEVECDYYFVGHYH